MIYESIWIIHVRFSYERKGFHTLNFLQLQTKVKIIAIFVNWRLFHDLETNQGLEVRCCV